MDPDSYSPEKLGLAMDRPSLESGCLTDQVLWDVVFPFKLISLILCNARPSLHPQNKLAYIYICCLSFSCGSCLVPFLSPSSAPPNPSPPTSLSPFSGGSGCRRRGREGLGLCCVFVGSFLYPINQICPLLLFGSHGDCRFEASEGWI